MSGGNFKTRERPFTHGDVGGSRSGSSLPVASWRVLPSGKMGQAWEPSETVGEVEYEVDLTDVELCPQTRPTLEHDPEVLAVLVLLSTML